MNLKLEIEFNKTDIIQDVEALKKQVDTLRPLPADVEGKVMQKLRLDWNYHSNAIEGNRLNYGETVAFLMEGITAKGKPLKDHLDIRGHNDAINFLLEIIKDTRPISEADIRALHKMILVEPYDSPAITADGLPTTKRITLGEYKTSPNHVKTSTGEIHYYASPEETPAKMHELMNWYAEIAKQDISPIIIAALFHHKFVAIHPFDDGNGRLSRILMNLILMQHAYPPVVVKMDDRKNYYSLLSRADVGDSWPFVEYIAELMQSSLQLYLKAANGGNIDEDEDIDKEIALYKMELRSKVEPQKKEVKDLIYKVILETIFPLFERISIKLVAFNDFFDNVYKSVEVSSTNTVLEEFRTVDDPLYDIYENIQERIKSNSKIKTITLTFNFQDFKNPENIFDVVEDLFVEFESGKYLINNIDQNLSISKSYNESLTTSEQDLIIKNMIKDIKLQIDDNFNEY